VSEENVYDTHVAWALLEAERIMPDRGYARAALNNVTWALSLQQQNGWFPKCCLTDPDQPLTHTIGYLLRGLVEAYRFSGDPVLLSACRRTADGLVTAAREDGFLPGRLNRAWRGTVNWACLTGSAQIALCWLLLYQSTSQPSYQTAAYSVNAFVRRTMDVTGPPERRGAIKGSFPIDGGYCSYEYPSWACKFFVDAHMLESAIRSGQHGVGG
jgi:hypothetical protein